jgi:putative phosphoribosyl transferase
MAQTKEKLVKASAGEVELEGFLTIPENATGIVLFAHGSGSSRHSPRNQAVAKTLSDGGVATLLIDLLTQEEEKVDMVTRELRFDIGMLAGRVAAVVDWLSQYSETEKLNIGLFGSSTGAAAALVAAAEKGEMVKAVVSRGGRPDLAGGSLPKVRSPSLFIVGGNDSVVIDLNKQALDLMNCEKRLSIIEGATHLFEEHGTLEDVADQALTWFKSHLS